MNSFNGIDIGDLVLSKAWSPKIIAVVDYASDTSLITYEKDRSWTNCTLYGGESWGWLSEDILTQLSLLASEKGSTFPLVYSGVTHIVRFRTELQDVIKATPVNPHSLVTEYNNIEIQLTEV